MDPRSAIIFTGCSVDSEKYRVQMNGTDDRLLGQKEFTVPVEPSVLML